MLTLISKQADQREWNAAQHAFGRAASEETQAERERCSLSLSLTLSLQRRITCFLSSPFRRSMLITLRRVPSTSNAETEEPRSRSSWRWGSGESDKHPQHCCDPPERLTQMNKKPVGGHKHRVGSGVKRLVRNWEELCYIIVNLEHSPLHAPGIENKSNP